VRVQPRLYQVAASPLKSLPTSSVVPRPYNYGGQAAKGPDRRRYYPYESLLNMLRRLNRNDYRRLPK
jgi:hypothetical protein